MSLDLEESPKLVEKLRSLRGLEFTYDSLRRYIQKRLKSGKAFVPLSRDDYT